MKDQELIGKTLAEAELLLPARVRPVKVDGQFYMVTQDLRMDRVNVVVEKGIITEIKGRG